MSSREKSKATLKRAALPREAAHTKAFIKDWARHQRTGRANLAKVKEGMLAIIANDGPMDARWLDHDLSGDWQDHREFHAGGDLLVIYTVNSQLVTFVRLGSHAELFE